MLATSSSTNNSTSTVGSNVPAVLVNRRETALAALKELQESQECCTPPASVPVIVPNVWADRREAREAERKARDVALKAQEAAHKTQKESQEAIAVDATAETVVEEPLAPETTDELDGFVLVTKKKTHKNIGQNRGSVVRNHWKFKADPESVFEHLDNAGNLMIPKKTTKPTAAPVAPAPVADAPVAAASVAAPRTAGPKPPVFQSTAPRTAAAKSGPKTDTAAWYNRVTNARNEAKQTLIGLITKKQRDEINTGLEYELGYRRSLFLTPPGEDLKVGFEGTTHSYAWDYFMEDEKFIYSLTAQLRELFPLAWVRIDKARPQRGATAGSAPQQSYRFSFSLNNRL